MAGGLFYYLKIYTMKLLALLSVILLSVSSRGCEQTVEQGLAGQVLWLEGNLMPTIGKEADSDKAARKGQPVQREIYVYELTSMDEATSDGTFFSNIKTELVKTTETNKDGVFAIELPAGRYSVFVKEEQGLFANSFNGEGYINPVEVKEGELTKILIQVNYKAAY